MKNPAKAKKSNNSNVKAKKSGLSNLIKNITNKVVGASSNRPVKPKSKNEQTKNGKGEEKSAVKAQKSTKATPDVKPANGTKPVDEMKPTNGTKPVDEVKAANKVNAPKTKTEAASPTPATSPAMNGEAQDAVDDAEVVLTDAEGRRYCRATDCDQIGMVDGYCRYHYLYFWKKIQVRKKILADGKLERYIDELTARYSDKFIELLRKDLRTEKDFLAAIQELELDDAASSNSQSDEDETKTYLEEISGVASETGGREDEGY